MTETPIIYGLFIGINEYESNDISSLSFASADVLCVRDRLADRFGLRAENTVVIADGMGGPTPKRLEILKALDRFAAAPMNDADTFFMMFAGHGFTSSGKMYLAARDSEISSETLLRETAVAMESIRDFLAKIPAGQHVVFLDACRDSPRKGTRGSGKQAMSDAMTRDIGAVFSSPATTHAIAGRAKAILCSCWEGQVAHEYAESGHGWFCHNLLSELDAACHANLSLADLHTRVKNRMRDNAWRDLPTAKDQTPHLLVEGDIPVMKLFKPGDMPQQLSGLKTTRDILPVSNKRNRQPEQTLKNSPDPVRPLQQDRNEIEERLLSGQVRAAIQLLQTRTNASPRDRILHCLADLMIKPMRKLRNDEAREIVEQLDELATTTERPIAIILLATLAEHYYRPLRRRCPSIVAIDPNMKNVVALDGRTRRLVNLIPESKEFLSHDNE